MAHDVSEPTSPLAAIASRWTVALCALAGLLLGLVVFAIRSPVYESTAIVDVRNPPGTMADEAALVQSDRVLVPVEAQLGFRPELRVEAREIVEHLTITARSSSPDEAARAAQVVVSTYQQSQTTAAVSLFQVPAIPDGPVSPNRLPHVLIGSALGALAGAAVSWLRSLRPAVATPRRAAGRREPLHPPVTGGPSLLPVDPTEAPKGVGSPGYTPVPAPVANEIAQPVGGERATVDDSDEHSAIEADDDWFFSDLESVSDSGARVDLDPLNSGRTDDTGDIDGTGDTDELGFELAFDPALLEERIIDLRSLDTGDQPADGDIGDGAEFAIEHDPDDLAEGADQSPEPSADSPLEIAWADEPATSAPGAFSTAAARPTADSAAAMIVTSGTSRAADTSGSDDAADPKVTDQLGTDDAPVDDDMVVVSWTGAGDSPEAATAAEPATTSTGPGRRRAMPRWGRRAERSATREQSPDPLFLADEVDAEHGDESTNLLELLDASAARFDAGQEPSAETRSGDTDDTVVEMAPTPRLVPVDNGPAHDEPAGRDDPTIAAAVAVVEARYAATIAELRMAHDEATSRAEAEHERQVSSMRGELAEASRRASALTAELKRQSGDDQHRVGDLEAQVEALGAEVASVRDQLERERLSHVREITSERQAADNALDNARREHLERRNATEHEMRQALAGHRADLERSLTEARAEHRHALEQQHREYEETLQRERDRHRTEIRELSRRYDAETSELTGNHERAIKRQADQLKQTVAELRRSEKRLSAELDELRQAERQFRTELSAARQRHRDLQHQQAETEQTLREELAVTRRALVTEKERNAALRDDVIRRTAEVHQAAERSLDDRSAELAELESLVVRQREQAEQRVREVTAEADQRASEAARRESELAARVTELERLLHKAEGDPA